MISPNPVILRFALMAVVGSLLVGCGESKKESGPAKPKMIAPNELLQVSATALERDERPTTSDQAPAGGGTSEIGIEATGSPTAADHEAAKLSPDHSGWDSEGLNTLAAERLQLLAQPLTAIDFSDLLTDNFESSPLLPTTSEETTLPGGIVIIEGTSFTAPGQSLAQELAHLRNRIGSDGGTTIRFKPVAVEMGGGKGGPFTTEVLVEVVAPNTGGATAQIDARWHCTWTGERSPKLTRIAVKSYREVRAPSVFFQDVTRSVFRHSPSFARQMMHGIGYWAKRLTRVDDMMITGHHGIAVGDLNGDGLDDIYACDGGGLPNRLYLQTADGSVVDYSAASQVDFLEDSRSALIVDLDQDGDQDLVVATVALVLFAENDGTGTFTLRGGHPGSPSPYSLAAADYDNDGDLDIYVTSYGRGRDASSGAQGFEASSPIPYNDANNGGRNILLANHGKFRFSDLTQSVGLDTNNSRWTFAAAWEDFDQDGDADLYVVNDFGRNNLYRNEGGRFSDIAATVGVEDMAGGMSASWGDSNGDGKMDLYVGNMFSAAGNRVTYQRKFNASRKAGDTAEMQRMARGNSLFHQGSDGLFRDASEEAGVTMGRWAWSSSFVDLNNDGWEDLVIANGYLSNPKTDDL